MSLFAHRCVMVAMRLAIGLCILVSFLASCSSTSSYRGPGVDLAKFRTLYVERNLADDRGLHEMIATELRRLGYEVSTGHATMMPRGIQAIVTYRDEWTWDFKTYLIDIEVTVREARSARILAKARYFRPGITNKAPAAMVRDVVDSVWVKPGK